MILFRESLRNINTLPIIILDENRNDYLDGLSQYRETGKLDLLIKLMNKEAENYFQQCRYFM